MAEQPESNHVESQVLGSNLQQDAQNGNVMVENHSSEFIQQSKFEKQLMTNGHQQEEEVKQNGGELSPRDKIEELQYQVKMKDKQLQAQQIQIEQLEQENEQYLRQLKEKENQLQKKANVIREREKQLRQLNRQLEIGEQQTSALMQQKSIKIQELERDLIAKDKHIHELQQQLRQRSGELSPQNQTDSSMSFKEDHHMELSWRECERAPCEMIKGSAAVDGHMVYYNPDFSGTVYEYNSEKETWSVLPECPHMSFTLAVINSLLTAVGGWQSMAIITNQLISIKGTGGGGLRWKQELPPMPTKRSNIAIAQQGKSLIAAGGYANGKRLTTVEVLNTETYQWLTAASLPHPFSNGSLVFAKDRVCMLGGYDHRGVTNSVLMCSVHDLLKSCLVHPGEEQVKQASIFRKSTHNVWQRVANLPLYLSTCSTLNGQLLAIGGKDSKSQHRTAVHAYNVTANSWSVVSHMTVPRSHSMVVELPGNTLAVVGGWTFGGHTTAVEIATVV